MKFKHKTTVKEVFNYILMYVGLTAIITSTLINYFS